MKETVKKLVNSRNWEDFLIAMEFLKGKTRRECAYIVGSSYTTDPIHLSGGVNGLDKQVKVIRLHTNNYVLVTHLTAFIASDNYECYYIDVDLTKDL